MFPIDWETGRVDRVVWRLDASHYASYPIVYNHIGSVRVCVEVGGVVNQYFLVRACRVKAISTLTLRGVHEVVITRNEAMVPGWEIPRGSP
jgi:hypothetical protein